MRFMIFSFYSVLARVAKEASRRMRDESSLALRHIV